MADFGKSDNTVRMEMSAQSLAEAKESRYLNSNDPTAVRRFKLGVLMNPKNILAYEKLLLEQLLDDSDVHVVFLPIVSGPTVSSGGAVYRAYDWLDQKLFATTADPCHRVPIDDLVKNRPPSGNNETVDLLLSLQGSDYAQASIVCASELGTLRLNAVDSAGVEQFPFGYWEVMRKQSVTAIQLLLTDAKGEQHMIACSRSATDPVSPRRNRENNYSQAGDLLYRAINKLKSDFDYLDTTEASGTASSGSGYTADGCTTVLPESTVVVKNAIRKIPDIVRFYFDSKLTREQWHLLFEFSSELSTNIKQFKSIIPPKDRIWADPHVVYRENRYYVFIEEMLFAENKGFISVFEIDEAGRYTLPEKILEENFHLSYPQIIEWQGEIYMLPEASESGQITLYRCTHFPNQWEKHKTLMKGIDAVDASLVFHSGKWWIFAGVRAVKTASENDNLHIFYSDDLLSGEWKAHENNPVLTDVTRARPGGKIFSSKNNMIRPSQDCSRNYGYGLNLNRINRLSETEYEEHTLVSVTSDHREGLTGVHTFVRENNLTMVDACRRIPRMKVWGS